MLGWLVGLKWWSQVNASITGKGGEWVQKALCPSLCDGSMLKFVVVVVVVPRPDVCWKLLEFARDCAKLVHGWLAPQVRG